MATTSDIKNGICIKHNNVLYTIVSFQHVKPGKGPAFVRSKLKSLTTGKVLSNTFTSGAKIDIQRVERRRYQYIYKDDSGFHFMNTQTFEQTFMSDELINAPKFLKEGQEVEILFHTETNTILSCDLPAFVELEVTYTEPGEKGNTAQGATKLATLETGVDINVPLFINTGEILRVDTRTSSYSERMKK